MGARANADPELDECATSRVSRILEDLSSTHGVRDGSVESLFRDLSSMLDCDEREDTDDDDHENILDDIDEAAMTGNKILRRIQRYLVQRGLAVPFLELRVMSHP